MRDAGVECSIGFSEKKGRSECGMRDERSGCGGSEVRYGGFECGGEGMRIEESECGGEEMGDMISECGGRGVRNERSEKAECGVCCEMIS